MTWDDRNKISQCSKLVVTVSNWHFNRNTLKDIKAPVCKLENVMVTLKLSSTVFESGDGSNGATGQPGKDGDAEATPAVSSSPGAATNGGGGAATSQSGEVYHFDKNGAIIPYAAFVALLDSEAFHDYLFSLKRLYKGNDFVLTPSPTTVVSSNTANDDDNDDGDDDDDEEVVFKGRKRRKEAVKKMRSGKAKKVIIFDSAEEEEEEEDDVEPPRRPQQASQELGVTPLPSENEEESDQEDRQQQQQQQSPQQENNDKGTKKEGIDVNKEERPQERKTRHSKK